MGFASSCIIPLTQHVQTMVSWPPPVRHIMTPMNFTSLVSLFPERLVVVTGCDSGFGSGLVSELCKKGFIVVAACFSKERAEDITNTYDGAWGVSGDLTKSLEPVLKTVHELLDENASLRLWAVVNNAGIAVPGNVEWLSPDIYERTMVRCVHTNTHFNPPSQASDMNTPHVLIC